MRALAIASLLLAACSSKPPADPATPATADEGPTATSVPDERESPSLVKRCDDGKRAGHCTLCDETGAAIVTIGRRGQLGVGDGAEVIHEKKASRRTRVTHKLAVSDAGIVLYIDRCAMCARIDRWTIEASFAGMRKLSNEDLAGLQTMFGFAASPPLLSADAARVAPIERDPSGLWLGSGMPSCAAK